MATNLAIQLWPEPLRTLAFGSISGTYMGIGTATINPTRVYWIQNDTDVMLTFSWDGVTDHFTLPSGGFFLMDGTANSTIQGGAAYIQSGTRTYVKGSPTTGSVNLTVIYGRNG